MVMWAMNLLLPLLLSLKLLPWLSSEDDLSLLSISTRRSNATNTMTEMTETMIMIME